MKNPILAIVEEMKEADRPTQYLLDKFQKSLDKKPQGTKRNKHQNNAEYLPISQVQNLLNTYYLGRWQTKNFQWSVLHDQLCGTIELHLFNPITKEWNVRTGVASTQIRCDRNTGKPIKAGLTMDLPRLKSDCLKNATKGLGKVFGRDLNRDSEAQYNASLSAYVESQSYVTENVEAQINACKDTQQLLVIWDSNPLLKKDAELKELFEERKNELLRNEFG